MLKWRKPSLGNAHSERSECGGDRTIKLWDLTTGQLLNTLDGCYPVTFSPDGKKLVSGGDNHTVKIWQKIA